MHIVNDGLGAFAFVYQNPAMQAAGLKLWASWCRITDGTTVGSENTLGHLTLDRYGLVLTDNLVVQAINANVSVTELLMTNELAQAVDLFARNEWSL